MKLIADWAIKAFVLLITTYLLPGFTIDSFVTAFLVALVLGILNMVLKPILTLLTLPINILTLGLFTFVLNAFMIMTASYLVKGFHVESLFTAIVASVLMALITGALNMLVK